MFRHITRHPANRIRYFSAVLLLCLTIRLAPASAQTLPAPLTVKNYTHDHDANVLNHVAVDGDTLWFGGRGGVVTWNTVTNQACTLTQAEHGLPDDFVLDIAVDSGGDVWIATDVGLGRRVADGPPQTPWTIYDPSNSPLSPLLGASAVAAEPTGGVWVGTLDKGLFHFDGLTWTHFDSTNSGLINPFVTSILVDLNGHKWIGTGGGLFEYDDRNWTWHTGANTGTPPNLCSQVFSPPPEQLGLVSPLDFVLGVDPFNNVVWIENLDDHPVCLNDGTTRSDNGDWSTFNVWNSAIHFRSNDVAVDSARATWIVSDGGIQTFEDGLFFNYDPPAAPSGARCVTAHGDDVWFGTPFGVSLRRGGVFTNFTPGGLAADFVQSIAFRQIDGTTEAWIGHDGGLQRFDGRVWEHFHVDNSPLPGYVVRSIAVEADGSVWLASGRQFPQSPSDRGAVQHLTAGNWVTYDITNSGLISNQVRDIAIDPVSGDKWFAYGDINGGLTRFDGSNWTHWTPNCPFLCAQNCVPFHFMRDLEFDDAGVLWIANEGCGLVRFDGQTWTTYGEAAGLPSRFANDLAVGDDGSIWVATAGGLSRFDAGAITTMLPGENVREVAIDAAGRVWASVFGVGVRVLDGQTWTTLGPADGLIDDRVHVIAFDPHGDVWLGTEAGMSVILLGGMPGDIDADGDVDHDDAIALTAVLIGTPIDPSHVTRADINRDGHANGVDIGAFVSALLGC